MRLPVNNGPELPLTLETQLERNIAADPAWLAGIGWGKPRSGHPEGKVIYHIRDVLNNIDFFFGRASGRSSLRQIALIHDTFKYQAAQAKSGTPESSHGYLARQFAERYINDRGILQVIEFHDEAYKASLLMTRHANRDAAEKRAIELIARLGHNLDLFMRFYLCDNRTGNKSTAHYEWFEELTKKQVKPKF